MRLIKVINAGSPAALTSVYAPISSMRLLTRVYGSYDRAISYDNMKLAFFI